MGRARTTNKEDGFAAVFGTRRGLEHTDLAKINSSLSAGDFGPALAAVDNGSAERDPHLISLLSLRLADVLAQAIEAKITHTLPPSLLRTADESEEILPIFNHQEFYVLASAAVFNQLQQGCNRRRGSESLMRECERAISNEAYAEAARYIRSGGMPLLRQYFGKEALDTFFAPPPVAQKSLLVKAVEREFVEFLLEHSEDQHACANKLKANVVYMSLRGKRS
jgi:hypothetical protein